MPAQRLGSRQASLLLGACHRLHVRLVEGPRPPRSGFPPVAVPGPVTTSPATGRARVAAAPAAEARVAVDPAVAAASTAAAGRSALAGVASSGSSWSWAWC